jgi:hypothetical protein
MAASNSSLEFDLLYSQATELFKAFPEFQFKTVTALLVIIGWLVTSGGAQTFIHDNSAVALPSSVIAFGLLIIFKFVWIIGHYRRMREMHRRLIALAPMKGVSVESVAVFDLRPVLPATYLVVNILLSSAAVTVIWLICHPLSK